MATSLLGGRSYAHVAAPAALPPPGSSLPRARAVYVTASAKTLQHPKTQKPSLSVPAQAVHPLNATQNWARDHAAIVRDTDAACSWPCSSSVIDFPALSDLEQQQNLLNIGRRLAPTERIKEIKTRHQRRLAAIFKAWHDILSELQEKVWRFINGTLEDMFLGNDPSYNPYRWLARYPELWQLAAEKGGTLSTEQVRAWIDSHTDYVILRWDDGTSVIVKSNPVLDLMGISVDDWDAKLYEVDHIMPVAMTGDQKDRKSTPFNFCIVSQEDNRRWSDQFGLENPPKSRSRKPGPPKCRVVGVWESLAVLIYHELKSQPALQQALIMTVLPQDSHVPVAELSQKLIYGY